MRPFLAVLAVLTLATSAQAARVPIEDVIERAKRRNQPSLFQVWQGDIKNIPGKTEYELLAMHDLTVQGPWYFKLEWELPASGFIGDAVAFTPASIQAALEIRRQLLALNPNIILIGEIRNYDAQVDYLPPNSPYWLLQDGQKVPSVSTYFRLDAEDSTFQQHLAQQAVALMDTGVFDGIFLDWAKDNRYGVIKAVRDALGDNAVIMGNVNVSDTPKITPLMNAVFMESIATFSPSPEAFWTSFHRTVDLNHKGLREPKLVGAEVWADHKSAVPPLQQENHMRAGFTSVLTTSNGFYAYYPDGDGYSDHEQHFYEFWSAQLGQPLGAAKLVNGAHVREFTAGTAIYNPIGNQPVTLTLDRPHQSMRTGQMAMAHTTPAYDGDIFVNDTAVPSDLPPDPIPGGGAGGTSGLPVAGQGGTTNAAGAGSLAGGSGMTGLPGGGTSNPAVGGSANTASGGAAPAGGGTDLTNQGAPNDGAGCGCRVGKASNGHSGWLALFALGLLVRRRQVTLN